MTATTPEQATLPPRPLIRAFWRLHRGMYRLTGGRFGLHRPERGAKFGVLRLHTLGRRSGQARIAMVGYYEDGPNLVTLAMNGWGTADPAWWLNLQANPAATVDLEGGSREVRARAASGEERERLWATFRDYPGWGSDIGALAARRPGHTDIVVLEPMAWAGPMNDATAIEVGAKRAGHAEARQGRRLRWRHLWLVPGLALAIFANQLGNANGVGILAMIGFGIAPDLPRLLGSRGRAMHDLLHQPVAAVVAVGVSASGLLPVVWLIGSLVWVSHVVIGWAVGDVPRARGPRRDA